MNFPKRWPDPKAEWTPPEDWSAPGSRERMELMDPGPLKPGDLIELSDGRVMRVVLAGHPRDERIALGLIDV